MVELMIIFGAPLFIIIICDIKIRMHNKKRVINSWNSSYSREDLKDIYIPPCGGALYRTKVNRDKLRKDFKGDKQ